MEMNMLNENHSDFHWKSKVEDTESLSGETLQDKKAVWEKLYSRLGSKPRRIRIGWYWPAAACLLLTAIILYIMPVKKQDFPVKNNFAKIQYKQAGSFTAIRVQENVLENIPHTSVKKRKPLNPQLLSSSQKYRPSDFVMKIENTPATFGKQENIDEQRVISTPFTNSDVVTDFTASPVKKKLKVVHINEIGEPIEENSNTARYFEHHFFQVRLLNQEVYLSPAPASGDTGFNFFKTKISSSN